MHIHKYTMKRFIYLFFQIACFSNKDIGNLMSLAANPLYFSHMKLSSDNQMQIILIRWRSYKKLIEWNYGNGQNPYAQEQWIAPSNWKVENLKIKCSLKTAWNKNYMIHHFSSVQFYIIFRWNAIQWTNTNHTLIDFFEWSEIKFC